MQPSAPYSAYDEVMEEKKVISSRTPVKPASCPATTTPKVPVSGPQSHATQLYLPIKTKDTPDYAQLKHNLGILENYTPYGNNINPKIVIDRDPATGWNTVRAIEPAPIIQYTQDEMVEFVADKNAYEFTVDVQIAHYQNECKHPINRRRNGIQRAKYPGSKHDWLVGQICSDCDRMFDAKPSLTLNRVLEPQNTLGELV